MLNAQLREAILTPESIRRQFRSLTRQRKESYFLRPANVSSKERGKDLRQFLHSRKISEVDARDQRVTVNYLVMCGLVQITLISELRLSV